MCFFHDWVEVVYGTIHEEYRRVCLSCGKVQTGTTHEGSYRWWTIDVGKSDLRKILKAYEEQEARNMERQKQREQNKIEAKEYVRAYRKKLSEP